MNAMPKIGDRVRVVLEGTVEQAWRREFRIGGSDGANVIVPEDKHVVSVEVLRPPVKVGDVIETAEELDALPMWSVVRENGTDLFSDVFMRYTAVWYAAIASTEPSKPRLPVTVLYLPDGAA